MRKLVITLVAALVVSGTAYGQSKSSTAPEKKQSKTRALRDNQMDRVTAAGEEQEALAANNSTITETNSGAVNLSGSAQMGAKGVNIVNETDALVGNGVNVWNGSSTAVGTIFPLFSNVKQDNTIDQSSRTEATLKNYKRGTNSQLNVTTSSDDTESSSSTSTKATTFSHTVNDSDIDTNTKTVTSSSSNTQSETKTSASTSTKGTTSNDTSSSNSTNATSSSTGSGSSSSSGGSSSHSNSGSGGGATSTTSGSQSNALATTGTGSATNHTDGSSSTDADTTTNNSTANSSDTTSKTTTASNSSTTTSSDTDTHATTTNSTLNTSDTKSSSKHVVKSNHETLNVQGAVSFDSASAQNIAVDGSKIDATNTYSVTLAGTAEQNATALNIVNAAGGMVANGINVARTSNLILTPTITQSNTISQTR